MGHTKAERGNGIFSEDQTVSPLIDDGDFEAATDGGVALKKGPWTSAEDAILIDYVKKHGEGNWNAVQKHSGLLRCGKSCRLRWANHLRPNLKKGAFTQEEEQLIIELHAKMGNKWARMAAHLPGRTDNEIKNYWNTRIKRRQRAGLPLYPPEVCMQALQESHSTSAINGGDKGPHDILQNDNYEIPDVVFDNLKANQSVLPYVSELPGISASSMLMKDLGSSQYYSFMPPTIYCQKRLRGPTAFFPDYTGAVKSESPPLFEQFEDGMSNKAAQSFGASFPIGPDPAAKNSQSFGVFQGSHSLPNDNFSASDPTVEGVKFELPSFQDPETDFGNWATLSCSPPLLESVDAFIQSPPPSSGLGSGSLSPLNSGLLDAVFHEAKTLSSVKNHASDKISNSSTPGDITESSDFDICKTARGKCADTLSSMGRSASSLFSECISASGSSSDEPSSAETFTESHKKSEPAEQGSGLTPEIQKEAPIQLDSGHSDALFASNWFEQGSGYDADQTLMTDAIATLLGDDLSSEYKNMADGASISNQEWDLGSCAWNNMPFEMSELP